ncbi:sugar ABC transporter permease [Micromonospora sp. WMMD882]|uniref:carbohydrate ABC transporter permease n=1 Tax=Micromonospora sp. WMMD882 TaxID=3015151 RepID=UPI00248B66E9|nr:sugar ABC transporter permease [Micromonospora sp. WMMD882]WBB80326.1 sugar ABC transporter permease [Micromonospora sp. WMMD882]
MIRSERLKWAAFLAPALAVYAVFLIYPVVQSGVLSFSSWAGPGRPSVPVGLANYRELFGDPIFWRALGNTAILLVVSVFVQLPIGLGLALIITSARRGMRFWRGVYFVPTLMSTVAVGILWRFVYSPDYGIVNGFLRGVGLDGLAQGWLGQTSTALAAVIGANVWQWAPFYMIIYVAALVGLDPEVYEAAALDGADGWQKFWYVTLPLLRPVLFTTAILSLAGSIKAFDLVYIMTDGGPSNSTELLATYMFRQGFTNYQLGYASSIAMVMFLLTLVLTVVVLARSNRREGAEKTRG